MRVGSNYGKENTFIGAGETQRLDGEEAIGIFAEVESVVGNASVKCGALALHGGHNTPLSRECHRSASALKFPLNSVNRGPQVNARNDHSTGQFQVVHFSSSHLSVRCQHYSECRGG
jgi:hypothetical protein